MAEPRVFFPDEDVPREIRFFSYSQHGGNVRAVAAECAGLAKWMHEHLMTSEQMYLGLQSLLDAKDRFVRACIDQGGVLLTENKDYQRG